MRRFSSRKSKARTMAAVFLMQPLGEFAASIISLAVLVTYGKHRGLPCEDDPMAASLIMNDVWRIVLAIGALPAFIAAASRINMPESPRYTLDVSQAALLNSHINYETWHGVDQKPRQFSKQDIKQFLLAEGNWRFLLYAATSWFLLDFTSYGLGINNPKWTSQIFTASVRNNITLLECQILRLWPTKSSYQVFLIDNIQSTFKILTHSVLGSILLIEIADGVLWKAIQVSAYNYIVAIVLLAIWGCDPGQLPSEIFGFLLDGCVQLLFNLGNSLAFVNEQCKLANRFKKDQIR